MDATYDPANLITITIDGKNDENQINQAQKKLDQYENDSTALKLFLEIKEHEEEDEGLFFENLKGKLQNFSPFVSIVVVSPKIWVEKHAEVLASLGSTELKVFETAERKKAIEWLKKKKRNTRKTAQGPGKSPKKDAPDQGQSQT